MDKLDFASPSFLIFMNQLQHDAINKLITANLILTDLGKSSSDQIWHSVKELQNELLSIKKIFDRIKIIIDLESNQSFSLKPTTILQLLKDLFIVSSKYCSEIEINGSNTQVLNSIPDYSTSLIQSSLFLWRMGLDSILSFSGKNNSPVKILCHLSALSLEIRLVNKQALFDQEMIQNLYRLKYKNPGLKEFALYCGKRIMNYLKFDFYYEVFDNKNSFVIKGSIPQGVLSTEQG